MIVYIHGFNSSPSSHKSNQLRERLAALGRESEFACPALPHWPQDAMALLEREVAGVPAEKITLVGSSLGGFYATYLTEKRGLRSVPDQSRDYAARRLAYLSRPAEESLHR